MDLCKKAFCCAHRAEGLSERRVKLWSFGIEEVLRDPVGLREFELFLEKEFSSENIKFWLAVKKLKSLPQSQVEIHALNIYRSVYFQGSSF